MTSASDMMITESSSGSVSATREIGPAKARMARIGSSMSAARLNGIVKKARPKTVGGARPGAGRPATGRDPSRTFRLSDEFMAGVDSWAARQDDAPSRSEAIRRLLELALKSESRLAHSIVELGPKAKGK